MLVVLFFGENDLEKNFIFKEVGEVEGMVWVEVIFKVSDSGFESV